MNVLLAQFEFSLLSKFRSELMGLSILGIMLAHIYIWTGLQVPLLGQCIGLFSRLSHTEGFLFLSGLELYYSMSNKITSLQSGFKNKTFIYKSFYKRRFYRLLVPFIIITFPFYAYDDLISTFNLGKYLLEQSSLYFWFCGNNGMWYISVSILLYALFPLIFDFIDNNWRRCLILIVILIFLIALIRFCFPEYYEMTMIGIPKAPVFIIGCYAGYLAKNNISISLLKYLLFLSLLIVVFAWAKQKDFLLFATAYESTIRLVSIPFCCLAFVIMANKKILNFIFITFRWLGKYSLELYILHMLLYNCIFSISDELSLPFCGLILFAISILICKPVHDAVNIIVKKLE